MEIITPQLGLFLWTLIIFLAFFFILRRFAWKPILGAIKSREESIENSLSEAKRAREEMEQLTTQNENLLKEARAERDKIIREANDMRDKLVEKAKSEASAAAQAEMDKVKQQIEAEKSAALNEIRSTSGAMAIEIAEKILRKQFEDKKAQQAFAEKLISELSQN
ncbi:MAG: F0F1 ATP synthase subunit B [Bacteroidota bacterium]